MTEILSEYLEAACVAKSPTGKTEVWEIRSRSGGYYHGSRTLGVVRWRGAWRQYVFFPDQQTLYNPGCLHDIAKFLEKLTTQHREAKKHAVTTAG